MADPHFDNEVWIARLAVALDAVAANAQPCYSPLSFVRPGPIGDYWSSLRRGYRALAARAKFDPIARTQFDESRLRFDTDPAEARAILREHPLMKSGLVGSGKDDGVQFSVLNRGFFSGLKSLVSSLAKLSVKEGGEEAARRLHRYLTAGANASIPAHEITVFHGLVVAERINLEHGAYLEPYQHAKVEFDLPDKPEPFPETSYPNAAVLVRSLGYGPGVVRLDDDTGPGLPHVQVTYEFPTEYHVDLERWFDDSKLLIDLLSIAARLPLLTRTRYVRLAKWIREINPNFAFYNLDSGGNMSDMWPKGHDLSKDVVDAFVTLSRGWLPYAANLNLAIRRLAASFSRPGGRFGMEDRVLDVAIALEVFYGGKKGYKLARRAAGLVGATAADQIKTFDQAKSFYSVRSRIVHSNKSRPEHDVLERELEAGRDLACRTLASVLERDTPVQWGDAENRLHRDTRQYIEAATQQRSA